MFWQILPSISVYVWFLEGFDLCNYIILYIYIIYNIYIYNIYIYIYIYYYTIDLHKGNT